MKKKKYFFTFFYSLVVGTVTYFFCQYLIKQVVPTSPKFKLWKTLDHDYTIGQHNTSVFKLLYAISGFIIWIAGFIRVIISCKENHMARNDKSRKPDYLIQDGIYSRVRHPMYGGFILLTLGICIGSFNLISLVIGILFSFIFVFNTYYEEKFELIPLFKEFYLNYKSHTNRLFQKSTSIVIFIVTFLSLFGIFL